MRFSVIWSKKLCRKTAIVVLAGLVPMAIEYRFYLPTVIAVEADETAVNPDLLTKPQGISFASGAASFSPARLLGATELAAISTNVALGANLSGLPTTSIALVAPFSLSKDPELPVSLPSRYLVAQATDSVAAERLAAADDLDRAGRYVDAALQYVSVLDVGTDSVSRNAAQQAIENYAERLLNGEFLTNEVLEFAQRMPSYDQLNSARSRYIAVAFGYAGGRYAEQMGMSTMAQQYYERCLTDGWRYVGDHPNDPLVLMTILTMSEAALQLGADYEHALADGLRTTVAGGANPLVRWSAEGILGAYELVRNHDPATAYIRFANVVHSADDVGVNVVLNDESVYHTVRAWYLYQLAHAQYNVGNNLGALENIEKLLTSYGDADGGVVELASYYKAFLTDHLAEDPNEGVAAFQVFLDNHASGELVGQALIGMGRRYALAGEYDYASQIYAAVSTRAPNSDAARIAADSIGFIDQHLAGTFDVASETQTPMTFAQVCGPIALHHMLARAGIHSTVDELTAMTAANEEGTSMLSLVQAAGQKGLKLIGVEASDVDELSLPLIAFVNDDHFIVVLERSDDRILIQDGLSEPIWTSLRDFEAGWSHKALVTTGDARVARLLMRDELVAALGGSGFPTNMYNTPSGTPPACTNHHHPPSCNGQAGFGGSRNSSAIASGGVGSSLGVQFGGVGVPGGPTASLNSGSQSTSTGINAGRDRVTVDAINLGIGVDVTDISIKSLGDFTLNFARSYANPFGLHRAYYEPTGSGKAHHNNIGHGWTHSMNVHIRPDDSETAFVLMDGYGNGNHFTRYAQNQNGFDLYERSGDYGVFLEIHTDTGTTWQRGVVVKRNVDTQSADYGKIYMVEPDGHTYEFTPFPDLPLEEKYARLVKVTDRSGNNVTLSYDHATPGVGKLTRVDTPSGDGRYLDFAYHASGQISRVRLMKTGSSTALKTFEYTYYVSLLIDVIEDGDTTHPVTYGYQPDDLGLNGTYLSAITDRNGNQTLIDCDYVEILEDYARSRKITISHAEGGTTTYDRNLTDYTNVIENWNSQGTNLTKFSVVPDEWGGHVKNRKFYKPSGSAVTTTFAYAAHRDVTSTSSFTNIASYEYNALGRVTSVVHGLSADPEWIYEYDASNQLTKAIDPNGRQTTYTYFSNGTISKVVSPEHTGTNGVRYEYNGTGQLTKLRQPGPTADLITTYEPDTRGNVTKVTDPESNITQMLYDDFGNVTKLTDPRGKITWYEYDNSSSCQSCGGSARTGRLTKITDPESNITEYEYDDAGNMTKVIDAQSQETDYEYDEQNRLTKVTTPGNRITTTEYNSLGLVTKVTDPKGTIRTFEYDYMGRQTKVTDPIGSTTTEYADDGTMTKVIDGGGREWEYAYDFWLKRLTKVTDPNSKVTKYEYDYSGQVTKAGAGALGNIEPTTYAYSSTTGQLTSVAYGAGGTVTYYYDATGRLTRFDDLWSALGGGGPAKTYLYDDAGRLETHNSYGDDLDYVYDAAGNVTDMLDYFGNATEYTYTDRGRVSTITAPGNRVWTYHYDDVGRVDDYTHGNGMVTDYQYDTDGRLTKIEHKDGATPKQSFTYALDNAGNITKTTNLDGSYWDYEYDGRYRLTKATRKSASTNIQAKYEYVYALRDNLMTKYIPWEDNFADAVIGDDWTASSGPWIWYGVALKSDASQAARLDLTTDDDNTEVQFSYLLSSAGASPRFADVTVRANAAGTQRLMVRMSTSVISLHYWNGTTWTQLASQAGGASAVDTWYDARIVTDGATVKVYRSPSTLGGGAGGAETEVFSYASATQFDSKQVWVHSPATQNPLYTNVRVLAEDLNRAVTFVNRDNNEINTMTDYNGVTTYAYDDWGRMSTETRGGATRTYSYVMGSKLAGVSSWGNNVQYGYGGDGKRNFRLLNSTFTHGYKWDAGYNVINEANSSGTLTKTYVVAPKPVTQASPGVPMEALLVNQGPVGVTLAEVAGSNPASGAYKYYAHDNIQSTRGLFEQNKAVAGTFEYTPYGENYASPAPAGLTHRFTGLDLDATTGQYYAPYRYYAPNLSRWLTRDPLGMHDGTHMFAYLVSRTVAHTDPLGLHSSPPYKHTYRECYAKCKVIMFNEYETEAGVIFGACCIAGWFPCCVIEGVHLASVVVRLLACAIVCASDPDHAGVWGKEDHCGG